MKVKAIIYDFDGVICDSVNVKTDAFAALYEKFGDEIKAKVVEYHLQHGGISRFEKFRFYQSQLLGKPVTEKEITQLASQFSDLVKYKVTHAPYIPGADVFLQSNAGRHLQYICTGTPENEIIDILRDRKIDGLFNGVYGSPKSKESIIAQVLAETGLEASEMLYFGDALTDYYAAKKFDMPFIGITNPATEFPRDTYAINDFYDVRLREMLF